MTPTKRYIKLCKDERVQKRFAQPNGAYYTPEIYYPTLDDLWEWAMEMCNKSYPASELEVFNMFTAYWQKEILLYPIPRLTNIHEALLEWILENMKEEDNE